MDQSLVIPLRIGTSIDKMRYSDCSLPPMKKLCHVCLLKIHQQRSVHGRYLYDNNVCPHRYCHNQSDHQTDARAGVPDSEVISIALVSAKYFANNHRISFNVMHQLQYLSGIISHSRFNRRLQALCDWMVYMPELPSDMNQYIDHLYH